jgi:hypothetical protein
MNPLAFGLILFVTFFTLLPYFVEYFSSKCHCHTQPFGEYLLSGIIVGIFFFFWMTKATWFYKFPRFRERETVIKEQGGHYMTSRIYASGKLFLTPTRLIFLSVRDNPKHNITIPLELIKSCSIYKMFGFLTMGVKVFTVDSSEIFIVNRPKRWIKALEVNMT